MGRDHLCPGSRELLSLGQPASLGQGEDLIDDVGTWVSDGQFVAERRVVRETCLGRGHGVGSPAACGEGDRLDNGPDDPRASVTPRYLAEHLRGSVGVPGEHQDGCLVGYKLLDERLMLDDHSRVRVNSKRRFRLAQAPVGVLRADDREPQGSVLAADELLPGRENPIRGLEVSELIERLSQQQSRQCVELPIWNSLDQAAHEAEIMDVAGQVSALDQDGRVGHAAGVEAPDRGTQRGRARDGAQFFEPLSLRHEDCPGPQPRHGGADNLAVERVGETHLARGNRHKAGLLQVRKHVRGDRRKVVVLERLAEREQFHNRARLRGQLADPVFDQIEQPARARQPVVQVPHSGPLDKRAGFEGAEHELTHVKRIAPSDPPEFLSGTGLHRTAQSQVQQGIEAGGAQIGQVDLRERAIPHQVVDEVRDRLTRSGGSDQEDRPAPGEVAKQRDSGGVEQRHVVGDRHHPVVAMTPKQGQARVLEERFRIHLPASVAVPEPGGKEAGRGAERERGGSPAAGYALRRVAVSRRHLAALVGEPGLADSGRAGDHHAVVPPGGQGLLEHFEVRPPADDRPPLHRNCHASSMAA